MAEGDDDSSEEKKHEATERKRSQARDKGQVARAPDAIKLVLMLVFFLFLLLPGSALVGWVVRKVPGELAHAGTVSIAQALHLALYSFGVLSLFLLILSLLGAVSGFVPGGWSASGQAITPDFNKLNPAKGFKKLFSAKRVTETLKSILKFLLVGGAALAAFFLWKSRILALPNTAAPNWELGLHAIIWVIGFCLLATVFIVAIDTPLQAFFHSRELRMTDKEVRDEQKDTNVSPEVRSRQKQAQERAARARMMEQVPEASAVVVNPSQYAVAFRYNQHRDQAPIVIATGLGRLAERIRHMARRHGVPIVSAPPLARALYYHGVPGEPIPTSLYKACAEVLSYVYQLERWANGQGEAPLPPSEADLGVDQSMDRHARRAAAEREDPPPG